MQASLKLTSVGTSTGVVIPKEMLASMNLQKGDVLHIVKTQDGYLLTPYDEEVQRQLDHGRHFMKEYRETFQALAK